MTCDNLLAAIRLQNIRYITSRVTYRLRVQSRRRDWLQQFQLVNISVQAQKYANEPKIFYDGIYFILLQCYRSDARTSAIK